MADIPVDFTQHGRLLGLAHLEELGHSGQTTGDVLGFGGGPGQLGDDIAGRTCHPPPPSKWRPPGGCSGPCPAGGQLGGLAVFILDGNARPLLAGFRLDDGAAGFAGHRVYFFLHGFPGNDVAKFDGTADLSDNRGGKGVPSGQKVARLDGLSVFDQNVGTIDDRETLALTSGFADNG
jgi:hypothetical protein